MNGLRRLAVLFTLAAFLHGCASQSIQPYARPPTGDRVLPRDIVVTAARFEPEAKLDLLLRSKAEMAGAGAGSGALEGAGGLLQGMSSCHDPYCGAAFLLLLPVFMGVGAVIGAVRDAPSAATASLIETGQKAMQEGIARLDLQRSVQGAVAKALRDRGAAQSVAEEWAVGPATPEEALTYETVNPQTRDAILEVSVLDFQFKKAYQPGSRKPAYRLSMATRIRLLAAGNRALLDEMHYVHESDVHTATEWLSGDARLFGAALDGAIRDTSRSVVHEMFLLYYPVAAEARESTGKPLVPDYVLRPVYPVPARTFDLRGAFMDRYKTSWGGLQFVPVDDLMPTLKWEAFPRPLDVEGMGGQAARFDRVRYEVVLDEASYTGVFYEPGAEIYRRDDLIEPAHRPELSLKPCGRYYWTVRAHFRLDGWPRVTEWTGAYGAFQTATPWEYRRGLKTGPVYRPTVEPRLMLLPFRVPAADGTPCK